MATAEGHGKKMITLISEDGENFEVEAAVAMESQTILHMIEDDCVDNGITIHRVNSNILSMVIEYCKRHVQGKPAPDASNGTAGASNATAPIFPTEDLKNWDTEFIKVDQATLYDLIMAANYLDIKGLLDLALEIVANMIKGKTPEEIHKTFHIKNDFTAAEEEEIKRENQWVFE